MPYIKKTIVGTASGGYGAQFKRMLETVFANTTSFSNVTVTTATDAVFDCSFTYCGAVIRIYNNSYDVFISVDGSAAVDTCDMDNFRSPNKVLVNILESDSCGVAVSFQALVSDHYCEIYFSFIPVVATMKDGSSKTLLLVGHGENGKYNINRTWLPVFVPYKTFAQYSLFVPGVTGAHTFSITETIGNANYTTDGEAIASPLIIDSSSIGSISQFKINNFPVYRIYVGPSCLTTTMPGQYITKVGDSEFVHFTTDALIRLS